MKGLKRKSCGCFRWIPRTALRLHEEGCQVVIFDLNARAKCHPVLRSTSLISVTKAVSHVRVKR